VGPGDVESEPASQAAPDNWSRWGADDERGALNLITTDAVRAGAGCVRTGKVYPLALPSTATRSPSSLAGRQLSGSPGTARRTRMSSCPTAPRPAWARARTCSSSRPTSAPTWTLSATCSRRAPSTTATPPPRTGRARVQRAAASSATAPSLGAPCSSTSTATPGASSPASPSTGRSWRSAEPRSAATSAPVTSSWCARVDRAFRGRRALGGMEPGRPRARCSRLHRRSRDRRRRRRQLERRGDPVRPGRVHGPSPRPAAGARVTLLEHLWLAELSADRCYEMLLSVGGLLVRGATGSPVNPIAIG